jgi:recombinational DNA repair protein RecR
MDIPKELLMPKSKAELMKELRHKQIHVVICSTCGTIQVLDTKCGICGNKVVAARSKSQQRRVAAQTKEVTDG